MRKIYYTWAEFRQDVETIARKLESYEIGKIYGIPRGGLVLAVALSHRLSKPLVLTMADALLTPGRTLLVDDISDTGRTLLALASYDNFITATIHLVQGTSFTPTIWVKEKPKDAWVVYPWEVDKEKT